MSTNYYWRIRDGGLPTGETAPIERDDPRVHLGKLSGRAFRWAQRPSPALAILSRRPDERLVEDEYGTRLTGREFLEIMEGSEHLTDAVGTAFT